MREPSYWNPMPAKELLDDERFNIDLGFYNHLLQHRYIRKYEITKLKLSDIHVQGGYARRGLEETNFYKSILENTPKEQYKPLIQSINEEGYDEKRIIIINYNNGIMDGQHRACCLMHKYGPNYEIDMLKLDTTTSPPFSKKRLIKFLINCIPLQKVRRDLRKKYHV